MLFFASGCHRNFGAYVSGWESSGGNPYLQPMESNQFDVPLEWYFAEVSSLTGTIFYKDLSNFFIYGAFPQTFTNPVSGRRVVATTSAHQAGGAKNR